MVHIWIENESHVNLFFPRGVIDSLTNPRALSRLI